ncbi:MAG: ATP-grasp domain-containing protein [Candidatus Levybacteria bacterium]|nr:ATP-grasp domain-containing protein [Candidatus Levybacteria bacterium]
MKVLVITGGDSSEREISFKSAENVKQTLEENGHKVLLYDLREGYKPIIQLSRKYDILFPVLHGEEGEGGKLHKFLNKIGKPIVGTRNYKGMQKAWYKIPFKLYCNKFGIPTAEWKNVKSKQDIINFGLPCVLKTTSGGSTLEVVILKDKSDLETADTERLLNSGIDLFVEKYIQGPEITVGILNNKAYPVLEIVPPEGSWFNYENKYSGASKEIPFAPSVPKKLQKQAQRIALKIHRHFNLGTYSRTDFMTTKDNVYALEINTIPGLTSESLMPKAAKATGMGFGKFLEVLLKSAE